MAETLVFLPAENYASVIYPEGRSRASSVAAELMLNNQEHSYGPPTEFKTGVYGNVIARYAAPTKTGRPLLAILTYPYSVAEADKDVKAEPSILLIEDNKVVEQELASDIVEVLKAKKKPTKAEIKKTHFEVLDACLDSVFPERYSWEGHHLLLHFPEVEITNSERQRHTIYDLFVRLDFNDARRRITALPRGTRATWTEEEATIGYRHSHLGGFSGEWGTFCLGHTPLAELVTDMMTEDIDEDRFLVLLHWITEYVQWESLEGGPHIRLGEIYRQSGPLFYSQHQVPPLTIDNLSVLRLINDILPKLDTDVFTICPNPDGTYHWRIHPAKFNHLVSVIGIYYTGTLFNYDVGTKCYMQTDTYGGSRTDAIIRMNRFTQNTLKFRDKNIQYTVKPRNTEQAARQVIQVVPPQIIRAVMLGLLNFMNTNINVYPSVKKA